MVSLPDLVIAFSPQAQGSLPKPIAAQQDSREAKHAAAVQEYTVLIDRLKAKGLLLTARKASEGHGGEEGKIWVLVRAEENLVDELKVKERSEDFLHGVSVAPTAPGAETEPATRLRLVHNLLTNAIEQGGVGLTPNSYPWAHVTSIFALHDEAVDKKWIEQWTKKDWKVGLSLQHTDSSFLLRHFGPAIALYFTFLSTYTLSLIPLAVFSVAAYFFLPSYSLIFALPSSLWALTFVEYWRAKERVLAAEMGTEGIEHAPKLRAESSPSAAEEVWWRRSLRVVAGLPVLALCATFLVMVLTALFMSEAFIANLYSGFGEKYIGLVPTICFSATVPQILKVYRTIAERLTNFEDHSSTRGHADALTRKTFALNSIVAYTGLAMSAFVYIPFGETIMRSVDSKVYKHAADSQVAEKATGKIDEARMKKRAINKGRLQDQMFAYTVTNQVVNAFLELGLPIILRRVAEYRGKNPNGSSKSPKNGTTTAPVKASASVQLGRVIGSEGEKNVLPSAEGDTRPVSDDERKLLDRIEAEAALPAYDLFTDYAEMVTQFGYVALWGVCWPLAAFSSLINNYFELRGDALKIVHNVQRPIPARVASIGPWLDALSVLSSLSAVTVTTLHMLFHPHDLKFRYLPSGAVRFLSPSYKPDAGIETSVPETLFPLILIGLASAQIASFVRRAAAYVMLKTVWEGSEQYKNSLEKDQSIRRAHLEDQKEKYGTHGLKEEEEEERDTVDAFWNDLVVDPTQVGSSFKVE